MARRRPNDPFGGILDSLLGGLEDAARDVIHDLGDTILEQVTGAPGAGYPNHSHNAPILKRANPTTGMKLKAPRTWTQICNWLAAQGFGNHYIQQDGPGVVSDIQGVTVHAIVDGQPRNLYIQLDQAWSNPHARSTRQDA